MVLRRKLIMPARIKKGKKPTVQSGQMTPIEYMLSVINDPKTDKTRRDDLAKFAAPYIDAKMRPLRMNRVRTKREKEPGKKIMLTRKAQNGHAKTEWNSDLN